MKQYVFFLAALAAGGIVVFRAAPASGQTDGAAPSYGVKLPAGYRDWKLISVAHEEGNLSGVAAVLGNDTAIKAYRGQCCKFERVDRKSARGSVDNFKRRAQRVCR